MCVVCECSPTRLPRQQGLNEWRAFRRDSSSVCYAPAGRVSAGAPLSEVQNHQECIVWKPVSVEVTDLFLTRQRMTQRASWMERSASSITSLLEPRTTMLTVFPGLAQPVTCTEWRRSYLMIFSWFLLTSWCIPSPTFQNRPGWPPLLAPLCPTSLGWSGRYGRWVWCQ